MSFKINQIVSSISDVVGDINISKIVLEYFDEMLYLFKYNHELFSILKKKGNGYYFLPNGLIKIKKFISNTEIAKFIIRYELEEEYFFILNTFKIYPSRYINRSYVIQNLLLYSFMCENYTFGNFLQIRGHHYTLTKGSKIKILQMRKKNMIKKMNICEFPDYDYYYSDYYDFDFLEIVVKQHNENGIDISRNVISRYMRKTKYNIDVFGFFARKKIKISSKHILFFLRKYEDDEINKNKFLEIINLLMSNYSNYSLNNIFKYFREKIFYFLFKNDKLDDFKNYYNHFKIKQKYRFTLLFFDILFDDQKELRSKIIIKPPEFKINIRKKDILEIINIEKKIKYLKILFSDKNISIINKKFHSFLINKLDNLLIKIGLTN